MKKVLLGVCTLGLLFASSCKKSESGGASAGTSGKWSFSGVSYTPTSSNRNDSAIVFVDNTGNNVTFFFHDYPKTDGTYNITWKSSAPAANEVSILAGTISPLLIGASFGSTGKTLNVKVSSAGKVSITCPDVTIAAGTGGTPTDSVVFSSTNLSE
ncbi:MAG: hypothetical protein WC716_12175 [Chitinophagaceae bacterium]|jgi:hypothetical protein